MSGLIRPRLNGGRYRADLLIKTVAAVAMTSVWRVQDVTPGLSGLALPSFVSIGAILILLLDRDIGARMKRLKSPITLLVLLVAAQLVISAVWSLNPARSRSFLVRDFSGSVVTYLVLVCAVRNTRDLRWFFGVNVVGAVIYCVMVLLRFRALDSLGRLCCTPYYDANDLSLVLVTVLPMVIFFFHDAVAGRIKARMGLAILIIMPVFQLAGSRGGFIGLAVVVGCALVAYRGIRPSRRVTSVVVAMLALFALGGASYRQKIVSIFHPKDDYNYTSDDGRIAMWKAGIAMAKQRPLVGFGPRMFGPAYGSYSPRALAEGGAPWRAAHNAYVETAAEAGVLAEVLFVSLIIWTLVLSWRVRGRALDPRLGAEGQQLAMVAQSNAIGLLGFIVSAVFLSAEYMTILYMMFGLAVVTGSLVAELERRAGTSRAREGVARRRARTPVPRAGGAVRTVGRVSTAT